MVDGVSEIIDVFLPSPGHHFQQEDLLSAEHLQCVMVDGVSEIIDVFLPSPGHHFQQEDLLSAEHLQCVLVDGVSEIIDVFLPSTSHHFQHLSVTQSNTFTAHRNIDVYSAEPGTPMQLCLQYIATHSQVTTPQRNTSIDVCSTEQHIHKLYSTEQHIHRYPQHRATRSHISTAHRRIHRCLQHTATQLMPDFL